MGGGGGGGGGFLGTGIGGDVGRAIGYVGGITTPFQALGDLAGSKDAMWGSNDTTPLMANSPEQQQMQKVYSQHLQKYAGTARPYLEQMLGRGPNTVGDSSVINPQATLNYFMNTAYQPAMRQLNEVTLPGIRESMGKNYWSTARRNAEQNAMQSTANNLSQQLAQLQYQDEQARRQMADTTQARNLQELGRWEANRLNQLQMFDPLYAQHFAPVSTAHTVDYMSQNNPGLMDYFGKMLSATNTGLQTTANLGKTATLFA